MPEYMIYKHFGYMKECGIDLKIIMKTMKILTILQEINITLNKQLLRSPGSSRSQRPHYCQPDFKLSIKQKAQLGQQKNIVKGSSKFQSSQEQEPGLNFSHEHSQISSCRQQVLQLSQKIITSPTFLSDQEISNQQILQTIVSPKSQCQIEQRRQTFQRVDYLIEQIHHEYVQYHSNIITLTYLFIKYRLLDISGKFLASTNTWDRLSQKKPYLNNTKNLFLKAYFLEDYAKNVKFYLNDVMESYPIANYYLANPNYELDALQVEATSLKAQIQLDYSQKNRISPSRAVRQLRNLVEITSIKSIGSPFLLGFWLATVILIIIAIIFIIVYFKINFTTNTDFQRTFPIWRGLWYFIYLIWLIGINSYIFNYFKINFYLLTAFNNYHLPNPSRLLICAAIFTSVHFFLFLLYLIKLAQIGNTLTYVPYELLPGLSWLGFVLFFVFPLRIFYFRQRLYAFMMFFRSIASPIIGVQFKFSIFIQIFVSFRQPFRDMMYTITYYLINSSIVYEETIMYETVAGIILYFFRIIQNCRMMYQNRICGGMPIYSVAKSLLGFITMITSYLSKNQTSHDYFYLYIWLLTALGSTSLAYYMDIWNDWGLLDPKFGYLRQKLIYRSKKIYYGIIFLNLILRFVWMLNVSPDVLRRLPVKPYVIIFIISTIEITRRGIWVAFRVQKEHISSENALNKLFVIQGQTDKQLQRVTSTSNGKQLLLKSPFWLKIQTKPQDSYRKEIVTSLIFKNLDKIQSLTLKLSQAQQIIRKHSSQQQKYLLD